MSNGVQFSGNIAYQGELIDKVERELAANFLANNDTNYVLQNYHKILDYLTTSQLKENFMNVIKELSLMQDNNQTISYEANNLAAK